MVNDEFKRNLILHPDLSLNPNKYFDAAFITFRWSWTTVLPFETILHSTIIG